MTPEQAVARSGSPAGGMVEKTASFDWLSADAGIVRWVESVPATGRAVQVTWYADGRPTETFDFGTASVGSYLHAYGANPYANSLAWVNASDGQVYGPGRQRLTNSNHTYGDLVTAGPELLAVREDEHGDELVSVGRSWGRVRVLRRTEGFLATPRLSTGRLAWAEWTAAAMPWDACEIWVGRYDSDGSLADSMRVAGGPGESATQPLWGPDGSLYFMSDRTGWWNLYAWRDGAVHAVVPMQAECAVPPWESGYATYRFLAGGRIAMVVQNGPTHRLVVLGPEGTVSTVELGYTSIKPYLAILGDQVALVGSSPISPQQIALVSTNGDTRVIRGSSLTPELQKTISVPKTVQIESDGEQITVLLYEPNDVDLPAPLIVRAHAGPTYHVEQRLDWEAQFFTSRGFAVADVDYRGSSGYGRGFRRALYGRWGDVDVADCRAAATHLLDAGVALPGAVFVSGASAGGYTALRAACTDGPFAAAAARSAIVDPNHWVTTAPRFQRAHAAALTHEYAAVDPDQVQARVLLVHGTADDVAPISDAAALVEALRERGKPVQLLAIQEAGHYLSTSQAVEALQAELGLYQQILNELAGHR